MPPSNQPLLPRSRHDKPLTQRAFGRGRDDDRTAIDAHGIFHRPDDRFIPVRAAGLARAIADDPDRFRQANDHLIAVAEAIALVIEQEATHFARSLDADYALYNPDRETSPAVEPDEHRTHEGQRRLFRRLDYLLDKANFERLSDIQVEEAIRTANTHGIRIRVDPEQVEHLALYVRGRGAVRRRKRTWRHPIRGENYSVEVYRRLAAVIRLREHDTIILKLFRDIPAEDLEALLPHATIHMNWFDRLKVFGGGAGALGGVATKLFTGAAISLALAGTIIFALFGLAFRSFMGYRRTKSQRAAQRTQHLYFQTLASNAAVLHSLVRLVAEEEEKEALLCYAFLAWACCSAADVDPTVEQWLSNRFGAEVNFDHADGLETLDRLQLRDASGGVVDPEQALRVLERHRRDLASRTYHVKQADRRAT